MDSLPIEIENLPGADIVADGIADLRADRVTPNACLVTMASPHLIRAGIELGDPSELIPEPERTLYRLLGEDGSGLDPYPRYNSLKRRIVSFSRALAARRVRNRVS